MTGFYIRKYEEKDMVAIQSLWNSIIDEGESYIYTEHFSSDKIAQMLESQDAVYCAVNEADKVIGFYILHPNFAGRASHIANAAYAVNKNDRGVGIGKMLGSHSLRTAKDLGFRAIQFNAVVSTNIGAVQLWESLGFTRIGEIPEAFEKNDGKLVPLYIYYRSL